MIQKLKSPAVPVIGMFLLLYLFTAPFTVQSGDTGELVTNSYFLRVVHPPGYPLWTLLYHIPIKYFSFVTPFHAASIVTILIACTWLGILALRFPTKEGVSLLMVLGSSLIFWRYSILPDVFALHLLFLVLVFLIFLNPELLKRKWLIFLVALSVTNHHTIVFAFPLYLYSVLQGDKKANLIYSLTFGLLAGSVYLLLLTFHTKDYGSWGNLNSLGDVWKHFIRAEYGTFRLQSLAVKGESKWFEFFLKTLLYNCWSLIVAIFYFSVFQFKKIKPHWRKISLLVFCLLIYFATFAIGKVMSMDGFGETVFERFLLQPILFLFFLALFMMHLPGIIVPQWILLFFVVNCGLNVSQNFKDNNYRRNTIIEDWAMNNLRLLPKDSVYLTHGDTPGSSTYYVQDVLKFRDDVIQIHPSYAFGWSETKVHTKNPEVFKNYNPNVLESIDYEKYSFFMNVPPQQLAEYFGLTYFGNIFHIYPSKNQRPGMKYACELSDKFQWRERSDLENLEDFENSRIYDLEYGRCQFMRGWELFSQGKTLEGTKDLERAVKLSRFSARFTERLCFAYKEIKDSRQTQCENELAELLALTSKQYYLYSYE